MTPIRLPGITRVILIILLGCSAARPSPAASVGLQLTTAEKMNLQREARLVVDLLQNHHFSGRAFREMESKDMVARYLDELDPRAEFLEAGEIAFLHRRFDRTFKTVYLFRGDLQPAFEIFDLFVKRVRERLAWVQRRLDRGFGFDEPGEHTEREHPVPFADRAEADHYWDLLLQENVLVEILRGRTPAEAKAEVKRRFDRMERAVTGYDSLAVRERFFDAIIRSFDPHSGYFSADSTREFAVEMEKSVVGLGLDLRKEDGRCLVAAVQIGGPADLHTDIQAGDVVEAVAEGTNPLWTDLSGLRLREIVGLLRGAEGTALRLAYRRGDEPARRQVSLTRTRVNLAGERAHGAITDVPGAKANHRIGSIYLPNFYAAGEDASVSSAARDIRELITQMDPDRLDGLVIDLRGNPGGAVTEALALGELFLPEGVMMLSRGLDGKVTEHRFKPGPPLYTGPLVVLIANNSASASEVFAGAMKYHRRALIVGAPATYGKGTVQSYLELAKLPGGLDSDWGTLRLTRERFYLPDGGSVQHDGVAAQVVLPDADADPHAKREADLPGALPADTVPPPAGLAPATLTGATLGGPLLKRLGDEATHHQTTLPEWTLMHDLAGIRERRYAENTWSLQVEPRRQVWQQQESENHTWEHRRRVLARNTAYSIQAIETRQVQEVQAAEDARLRLPDDEGQDRLHRLYQGTFVIETVGGRRRRVRLSSFNYRGYVADAAKIAAAMAVPDGSPEAPGRIEAFLRQASLLEYPTQEALIQLVVAPAGVSVDLPAERAWLERLLRTIVMLDDDLRQERASFDVALREAQRLAATWAAALAPPSAH